MVLKHTPLQLRALWAKARQRGLTDDELRALTPRGHLSDLTYDEAHELLNQLGERRAAFGYQKPRSHKPRASAGVARIRTSEQAAMIESLTQQICDHYGWTLTRFAAWLSERHHKDGRPMTSIDSARDGRDVIQLLENFLRQARAAKARNAESAPPLGQTASNDGPHRRQRIAASIATS